MKFYSISRPQGNSARFREPATLVDLETQERVEITPEYVRDEYRRKMGAHLERCVTKHARRMDYHLLVTDSR